jgi:mRNA interferase HigB
MRVRLVKRQTIEDYTVQYANSRVPFQKWLEKIKYADWNVPDDISGTFGTADILGNGCDRVVFDIGGNNYRMICGYYFSSKRVHLFICWIGTHAEYTELCNKNEQYTVDKY